MVVAAGFVAVAAASIVVVSRGVAPIAASLVVEFIVELRAAIFIAASPPERLWVAVTMAESIMVIDVAIGVVAGGRMASAHAGA